MLRTILCRTLSNAFHLIHALHGKGSIQASKNLDERFKRTQLARPNGLFWLKVVGNSTPQIFWSHHYVCATKDPLQDAAPKICAKPFAELQNPSPESREKGVHLKSSEPEAECWALKVLKKVTVAHSLPPGERSWAYRAAWCEKARAAVSWDDDCKCEARKYLNTGVASLLHLRNEVLLVRMLTGLSRDLWSLDNHFHRNPDQTGWNLCELGEKDSTSSQRPPDYLVSINRKR